MNVDNVIFIYEKTYLKEKLDKLIEKVAKKYPNNFILGLFTGKSYSFPTISLKEQEFFLKTRSFLKSDRKSVFSSIPLLFGSFCHNVTEESYDSKVKTINFYSKIFSFNEARQTFEGIPYETINMKDSSYVNSINPLANKIIAYSDTSAFENQVSKLKTVIQENLTEIETKQQKILKELKAQLKVEIDQNKKLLEHLKSFAV